MGGVEDVSETWRAWREAMADALYAPGGFYRSSDVPGRHFRTAAHVGASWATAILQLAERVDAALGYPAEFALLDVGAGGGELLADLAERAPNRWALVGVDIAARPAGLPDRVEWLTAPPDGVTGLVVAVELLDVVPIEVVEITNDGPRIVEVTRAGAERLGGPPDPADLEWLDRFWPMARPGDRAEIGRQRDRLWRRLVASLDTGVAVAVDYALDTESHRNGTLTGFRRGHQVAPVPNGDCDLTAHVQFESLRHDEDLLLSQREVLRALEVQTALPAYNDDPAGYLSALASVGETAELLDQGGLGSFTWLLHGVSVDPESVLRRSTRAAHTSGRTSPMRR